MTARKGAAAAWLESASQVVDWQKDKSKRATPTSLPDWFPNTSKLSQGLQTTVEDVKL